MRKTENRRTNLASSGGGSWADGGFELIQKVKYKVASTRVELRLWKTEDVTEKKSFTS